MNGEYQERRRAIAESEYNSFTVVFYELKELQQPYGKRHEVEIQHDSQSIFVKRGQELMSLGKAVEDSIEQAKSYFEKARELHYEIPPWEEGPWRAIPGKKNVIELRESFEGQEVFPTIKHSTGRFSVVVEKVRTDGEFTCLDYDVSIEIEGKPSLKCSNHDAKALTNLCTGLSPLMVEYLEKNRTVQEFMRDMPDMGIEGQDVEQLTRKRGRSR